MNGGVCTGPRDGSSLDTDRDDVPARDTRDISDADGVDSDSSDANSSERCNGQDDDGDGDIDEPLPCDGASGVCGDARRTCVGGSYESCENAAGEAFEQDETRFDGEDNDCDGKVDEVVRDVGLADDELACVALQSGDVYCWGSDSPPEGFEVTFPLEGNYEEVGVGIDFACARDESGRIDCWGTSNVGGETSPPSGTFVDISVGDLGGCAVTSSDEVRCWGDIEAPPQGLSATTVAVDDVACALRTDDTIQCWGRSNPDASRVPSGAFDDIEVGEGFACGLRGDPGSAECWSIGEDIEVPDSPVSNLVKLSVSDLSTRDGSRIQACGIRKDGRVECWGSVGEIEPDPRQTLRAIAVVSAGGLGVRRDGRLVYWDVPRPGF